MSTCDLAAGRSRHDTDGLGAPRYIKRRCGQVRLVALMLAAALLAATALAITRGSWGHLGNHHLPEPAPPQRRVIVLGIDGMDYGLTRSLMLQGRLPTPGQARVLDALLVASIEHGIAPPSMISRCFASYGP